MLRAPGLAGGDAQVQRGDRDGRAKPGSLNFAAMPSPRQSVGW
jgi:hypothetical protein